MKLVQINDAGTNLGIVSYVWRGDDVGMVTIPNAAITQDPMTTLGWFRASIAGDCFDELVQLRQNPEEDGTLTITAYRWQGDQNGFELLESQNMGSGTQAQAWLVADLDDSGSTEVVQVWDNKGTAAFLVYRWLGKATGWKTYATTTTQTSAGDTWLAADVDGDGRPEIVQVVTTAGKLDMAVYAWDSTANKMVVRAPMTSVDSAPSAQPRGWIAGRLTRSSRAASLIQVLSTPATLMVFEWSEPDGEIQFDHSLGMGDTSGTWFVGPPGRDGYPALIQLKSGTSGRLAMRVIHGSDEWSTNDAGQNAGGTFLAADTTCSGKVDILQLWGPTTLSMALYRWQSHETGYVGKQFNTTQPPTATNWLVVR